MRISPQMLVILSAALAFNLPPSMADERSRLAELDAYWATVSRAVKEGNFNLYVSTCHKDGVLVTGVEKQCYPLSKAKE